MNSSKINEAQQAGGGISYMKRYALESMLAWATGDYDFDDVAIEQQDKKTEFMKNSFSELAESFKVTGKFVTEIVDSLDIVTNHINRQNLYASLRDFVLPKYSEDKIAGSVMFKETIRNLS